MPLVVAFLPLLPAMARMNCPFEGPLNAEAGSAPKTSAIAMLVAEITAGLYEQVNSALVYCCGGTFCKLTLTWLVCPMIKSD